MPLLSQNTMGMKYIEFKTISLLVAKQISIEFVLSTNHQWDQIKNSATNEREALLYNIVIAA